MEYLLDALEEEEESPCPFERCADAGFFLWDASACDLRSSPLSVFGDDSGRTSISLIAASRELSSGSTLPPDLGISQVMYGSMIVLWY